MSFDPRRHFNHLDLPFARMIGMGFELLVRMQVPLMLPIWIYQHCYFMHMDEDAPSSNDPISIPSSPVLDPSTSSQSFQPLLFPLFL